MLPRPTCALRGRHICRLHGEIACLGINAPWTVAVRVGDTTNMAHTGGLASLGTHAFRTIACQVWKACTQMHIPGPYTFMNREMGG